MSRASIYDEVAFPSYPQPQSHPDHLATLARLCGLDAAPVSKCRVLELGCGAGGNLLPMADLLPQSQFVGIDLSEQQIALARRHATTVELTNIQFVAADILGLDDAYGRFDFVIAHGVFSWTTEPVREKILALLSEILQPNGVAYINYNTYPGWHLQGMLRDMLYFRANDFSEPADRVRSAREMIEFLRRTLPASTTPFGALVRAELEAIQRNSDEFLYHAYLNVINQPLYYHEFQQRAQRHELAVFGDADPALTWPELAAAQFATALKAVTEDPAQWPQLFDFAKTTPSRRSLLCHQAAARQRGPLLPTLRTLHFSGHLVRHDRDQNLTAFVTPAGRQVATNEPRLQATLEALSAQWPGALGYEQLVQQVSRHCPLDETSVRNWHDELMQCYCNNVIHVSTNPYRGCTQVSPNPSVSRVARYQAQNLDFVTNLRHQPVRLNDAERRFAAALDGRRSLEQISSQQSTTESAQFVKRLMENSLLLS